MDMKFDDIYTIAQENHASDVVLTAGAPPTIWVTGCMKPCAGEPLSAEDIEPMLLPALSDKQLQELESTGDVDFSVGKSNVGRLRVNIHRQRGSLAAAIRFVVYDVPRFEQLKLPSQLLSLARLRRGLVLITGATGGGKSTTLASLIEHMNHSFAYHVITLEDPIEYIFRHDRCVIEQREIGVDSPSFASALRHVLRQKPDVILVGEMRDRETMATALTAAETGHLVLATLHTGSAQQTIERILDAFPGSEQRQISLQLSSTLQAVVCQQLLRDQLDGGLTPAVEIMMVTPPIVRTIRDNETHMLAGIIETGSKAGMRMMDQDLARLVAEGRVALDDALAAAHDAEKLNRMISTGYRHPSASSGCGLALQGDS